MGRMKDAFMDWLEQQQEQAMQAEACDAYWAALHAEQQRAELPPEPPPTDAEMEHRFRLAQREGGGN